MNPEQPTQNRALSPISRRAFFQGVGKRALKLGALAAAAGSLGDDSECNIRFLPGSRCGYCDAPGQDYDHCDGAYCNYANYADAVYGDAAYCEATYCDAVYANTGSCGYCEAAGQDYEHCDGDYCDYINYADA